MPVPIRSIPDMPTNNLTIDYSFLLSIPEPKKKVLASNKDAELLFKIWSNGEKENNSEIIKLNESLGVNRRDIVRLKTMGLISTSGDDKIEFTKKGKVVISTMALGEESAFEKNRTQKNYTEILASMDKRGKQGYRIPRFATNNNNNLRLS